MSLNRAVVSIASVFLGMSPALAQQAQTTTNTKAPPLFEGIVVDAKGKIVGRFFPASLQSFSTMSGKLTGRGWHCRCWTSLPGSGPTFRPIFNPGINQLTAPAQPILL